MSLEPIIKDIKASKSNLTNYCPICDRRFYYNYAHRMDDPEKHNVFYNSTRLEYFITYIDLISFFKDHFNVIFYESNDGFVRKFISKHKFDYSDLKDFEIQTIKDFVTKVKKNLVFL